jgi:hypothetical protein
VSSSCTASGRTFLLNDNNNTSVVKKDDFCQNQSNSSCSTNEGRHEVTEEDEEEDMRCSPSLKRVIESMNIVALVDSQVSQRAFLERPSDAFYYFRWRLAEYCLFALAAKLKSPEEVYQAILEGKDKKNYEYLCH